MRFEYHVAWLLAFIGLADSSTPAYRQLTFTDSTKSGIVVNESHVSKLRSDGITPSVIILDYGKDVEGYPTFNVLRRSEKTSVFEISYSETRAMLNFYMVSFGLRFSRLKWCAGQV